LDVGWTFVPQSKAEKCSGFNPDASGKVRAKGVSLFFDDLLDEKVREYNPLYAEARVPCPASSLAGT